MKSEIRTLLRDIQAAARIGHIDSVYAALDGLLDHPQFSGNHPIAETTLQQVILPIGEALARPRLTATTLRPLTNHTYAIYRAVAGAALTLQYLKGINGTTLKDLTTLAQDPRQDVRDAIRVALLHSQTDSAEQLDTLYETWLKSSSPRLQTTALQILPHLPEETALEKIRQLQAHTLDTTAEAKKNYVEALTQLASGAYPREVLKILVAQAAQPEPDIWLISRSLAKPWAAGYPQETLTLLETLAAHIGPHKQIRKALRGLHHNGAHAEVIAALSTWQQSDNPQLAAAGRDEKLLIKLEGN